MLVLDLNPIFLSLDLHLFFSEFRSGSNFSKFIWINFSKFRIDLDLIFSSLVFSRAVVNS